MDMEYLTNAVGLASAAIGMTGKAASTADAIKKLFASDKAPDKSEAAKLVGDLASELTAANITNLKLSEALRSLSEQFRKEDEFDRERERYELVATDRNEMVYRLRAEAANGQPDHYVCPVCMHEKKINFIRGVGDIRHCQANQSHFFRFTTTPRQPRVRAGRSWMD